MNEPSNPEDRLLSVAEREMVTQTRPPGIAGRSKDELQALGKRLRQARDRARPIARQQSREISGKAQQPRGATPVRDNTLQRVTVALRKLTAPTQAELTRKAAERKRAAPTTQHPEPGRTAKQGMARKASSRPTVKTDPREIGRVSQAVKVAQRKRDR